MKVEWKNFIEGNWNSSIDVNEFIKLNYKHYDGDDVFLSSISDKTKKVWSICEEALKEEQKKGVLGIETKVISGINNFDAGYIDKDNEVIVGIQTDELLERIVCPYGGMRMIDQAMKAYGYELDGDIKEHFNMYRKTHNQGVFDAYSNEILKARKAGLITGLPDAYGRGRIIGDYRRIALYGIDFLKEEKFKEFNSVMGPMDEETIRLREEITTQYRALEDIKAMAMKYGVNISKPAKNALEAVQFLYFGYLAAVKENNGAAMSMGRIDAFLDIYIQRDLDLGIITEADAQELIDQLVIKLRLVRHLRTPDYDELFTGDPTWVTCAIGGVSTENRSMVTKTSYRLLHTLTNLDPSPEPNMTVLWADKLDKNFKKYCAKMSIITDSIQYENDDVMRPLYGDDYGIACCVSAMRIGKDMQFFGARANLAKALLYSINGGIDEIKKIKVIDGIELNTSEYLDYDTVKKSYDLVIEELCRIYSDAMNIIHYMHDKYAYEAGQMALHDANVRRLMAYGAAGVSVVADSLSAIKFAKVKPIRDEDGIAVDFEIEGEFPKYGNDDDRVDFIAKEILEKVSSELSKHKTYRNAEVTLSVLTITSNVVYGKKTGTTPDGRKAGVPFAPGANPMHCRDENGAIASLNSVAKLDYKNCCRDGISNTFTIIPSSLGMSEEDQINNLVALMDGYFIQNAHHLNVNVLNREKLIDAMNNPDKYPLLTIRVSGYAVRFNRLTKEQQEEVISRTFHSKL